MSVSRETQIAGSLRLARWRLRQDRTWWTLWSLGLGLEPLAVVRAYTSGYSTPAARESLQRSSESNAGLNLLYGRPFELNTPGGFVTWRILSFLLVLAGVAGALLVIRHLRGEEEDGRTELLRSAPVGPTADLVAVALSLLAGALGVATLTMLGLWSAGLPLAGSMAMGLTVGCSIVVWGSIAAVASQVVGAARTARMGVMCLLAAGFLLRGVGDAAPASSWVTDVAWLTPVGWTASVRPFVDDRWPVLMGVLLAAGVLLALAARLQQGRDIGRGFIDDRPGRRHAGPMLRSPGALVMRLSLVPTTVWVLALGIGGGTLGAIAPSIAGILRDTPSDADIIRSMGGQESVVNAYFSAILPFLALVGAVFALSIIGQAASAEESGIAAEVLATATSRTRWALAHVGWALTAPAAAVLISGVTTGVVARAAGGPSMPSVLSVITGAAVAVPGLWVITGAAFFGWAISGRMWPAWAVFTTVLVIVWLGPALRLPSVVLALSPFRHLPHLPGGSFAAAPVCICVLLAALSVAAGLLAHARRDVA